MINLVINLIKQLKMFLRSFPNCKKFYKMLKQKKRKQSAFKQKISWNFFLIILELNFLFNKFFFKSKNQKKKNQKLSKNNKDVSIKKKIVK